MGDYHRPNPFEIPLVVELVTSHSSPAVLLRCREVNHLWNGFATRKLTAEGWTVNLRSAERVLEYVKLTSATQDTGSNLPPMNLHVDTVSSTHNLDEDMIHPVVIELNNHMTAAANVGPANSYFGIQSFSCTIPVLGIHEDLRRLLQLVSTTIIALTLNLKNSEDLGRVETLATVDEGFNFPRLRSICLVFATPALYELSLEDRRAQIETVKVIIMASPCLELIRSTCCQRRLNSPLLLILARLEREAGLRVKLQQLIKLDITREEAHIISFHLELQLSHLRVLKISSYESFTSTVPVMFNERRREYLWLLLVFGDRCPALESLEITEYRIPGRRDQGARGGIESNLPLLGLPQLTHFGYRLKQLPETYSVNKAILDAQASVLCVVDLMNRFENLTTVTTNLQACIALGEVYRTANEYVMPSANTGNQALTSIPRPQLSGVTKVSLDVFHASVPRSTAPYTNVRHQDVVQLLRAMFPSLETLVINLGAVRVGGNRKANLGFLLGLAFEVDTIRRIEINNYYNGWALLEPPMPAPTPPATDPKSSRRSHREVNGDASSAAIAIEVRPSLETLVIRGVRPSFVNSHIGLHINTRTTVTPFSSPRLDLFRLRELIPSAIKPGLVLEIDGDLLMNDGLHSSYIQLQEEVNAMEQPRIRLI